MDQDAPLGLPSVSGQLPEPGQWLDVKSLDAEARVCLVMAFGTMSVYHFFEGIVTAPALDHFYAYQIQTTIADLAGKKKNPIDRAALTRFSGFLGRIFARDMLRMEEGALSIRPIIVDGLHGAIVSAIKEKHQDEVLKRDEVIANLLLTRFQVDGAEWMVHQHLFNAVPEHRGGVTLGVYGASPFDIVEAVSHAVPRLPKTATVIHLAFSREMLPLCYDDVVFDEPLKRIQRGLSALEIQADTQSTQGRGLAMPPANPHQHASPPPPVSAPGERVLIRVFYRLISLALLGLAEEFWGQQGRADQVGKVP